MKAREFEKDGFKAELIGPTTKVQLWINGELYSTFDSLRAARIAFNSYVKRHSTIKENPIMATKHTKAQLAARALFAQRAKAGTLKAAPKKNPKPRKTVKSEVESRKAQARSIVARGPVDVHIIETSKDKKNWKFHKVTLGATSAKSYAENLAEDYPSEYVRVRTESAR